MISRNTAESWPPLHTCPLCGKSCRNRAAGAGGTRPEQALDSSAFCKSASQDQHEVDGRVKGLPPLLSPSSQGKKVRGEN